MSFDDLIVTEVIDGRSLTTKEKGYLCITRILKLGTSDRKTKMNEKTFVRVINYEIWRTTV
ncbi:hypothetical protein FO440_10630 [Mucilaginibacter corticis]|uniref:Uncharacterized protein n=1 Tax=Mucilaginibacter corticis TaxID=2597670 RepID=A0A556MK16_9SPHI|nr:hypothetical protein [Mucilaginibacter corticis]TSJ40216.1 hypothetical protein FO440_10630 [Mucilaginibacter corticis]